MSNFRSNILVITKSFKQKEILLFLYMFLINSPIFAGNAIRDSFVEEKIPIIRAVSVDSPGANMAGYVGCKVIISGVNFIEVTGVFVDEIPVALSDYTVINESTIIFTAIPATGFVEVKTRYNGSALFGTKYINLGYITADSGNWNNDSTWLNKKVPPNESDTTVTIAHAVKIAGGIIKVGTLNINKPGELLLTAVLESYGEIVNKGNFNIEGMLRINEKSNYSGNSPIYTYSSVLQYKGYKGDVKDEWIGNGLSAGSGTPSAVVLSNGAEVRIPNRKISLESGIVIGDKCTFSLNSSELAIGGSWNKSGSAIFEQGVGNIIFRGSEKQEIIGDNIFANITVNNSKGVFLLGSTVISGTLSFILGKIILKDNDLTLQEGATIKGYNNRRYVVTSQKGKLWQNTFNNVVYPVGNASYNPVIFQSNANSIYGVRVVDSLPSVFDKEKMINKMWAVSVPDNKKINISVQYNRVDRGKNFDATNTVMGFYDSGGWNPNKAFLTEDDGLTMASIENLDLTGERYLVVGNPTKIKGAAEPIVVTSAKEEEPQFNSDKPLSVVVRPNPFTTQTNIMINSADAEKTVKIYDAEGKLVLTETTKGAGQQRIILGKDLPTGVYTAIVITSSNRKTIRIIKR